MRRQSMPLRFPCIIHCVAIAALIGSAGGAAAQGFQHAVNIERNVSVLSPARGVIDSFEGVNQLLPTKNYVVHVENGDSLSAIVSRLWGLQLTRKKLASLEETVRRENTLIAERSTTSLSLKPGDTLLVPREIDGRVKIDTLVLSSDDVSRNVQPEVLAAASTSALKGNFDVEIASLNPAERCALDKREPFNARAVMDRLEHVRKSTGRVFASPIVAMVDTAINGRFATIKDHIAPPIDDDRFGSESGGANVALALGSDAAMEQAGKPPSEHGIHIAGLILGGPNYLLADISSGSRPAIRLVPIVIEAPDKKISSSAVVDALGYARTRRARIINLSLEAKGAFESFQHIRAVGEVDQRLYVVAAGNGAFRVKDMVATNYWRLTDEDKRYWIVPAMLGGSYGENVISVAALGANDQRMGFSGFGSKHVDILAPGQCIDSFSKLEMKLVDSTRVGMSGTSQAAAITSFAASLLAAVIGPDFSPQRIKARLLGSAVLLPGVEDDILSRGKLSIERAVSIHEDIIHGMSDDEAQSRDHFGILVDHMGRDKPPRSLWLCTTRAATVGTVDKVVIKNTEPKKMTASIVSNLEAWQWADCPFHEGNFSKIWLKTSEGTKSFQIANVKEIVPKMSRLTK